MIKYSGQRKKMSLLQKGLLWIFEPTNVLDIYTIYRHGTSLSKHVTFILSCVAAEKQNT